MKLRQLLSHPIVWIIGLSLFWAVLIAFNIVPVLRGSHGWRWPFEPVLALPRIAPVILGMVVYVPVALWLRQKRSAAGLLLWAILGSIGLPLAAAYVREDVLYRLFTVTVSGMAGGWHMAAARITDLVETLRNWPAFMTDANQFSSHTAISPPGIVIVYYAASSLFARFPPLADALAAPLRFLQCHNIPLMTYTNAQLASAWLGMLTPVWGSLTIVALHRLGQRVFGVQAVRWAVIWWPLVPSFLLFSPLPHTFYPLPALIAVDLLLIGLSRNRPVPMVAAGLLVSALTFLTFAFAPLVLLAGLLTLGIYRQNTKAKVTRLPWHWPFQMGLWFGLGFSSLWLLFLVLTGVGPWDIWRAASPVHVALIRPYWPWIVLHLNDFFMFTGWPVVLLAGVAVWRSARKFSRRETPRLRDVVVLAAALTVFLVDISGVMRGETGRILLYLAPLVALMAARALDGSPTSGQALTVVQGLVTLVVTICLHVLASELTPPTATPPAQVTSAGAGLSDLPSGVLFGDKVRLRDFAGQIAVAPQALGEAQGTLSLWLKWSPRQQMDVPYYLALIPVAPDGEAAASATLLQPFQQLYPTTCWRPADDGMRDRVEVPLFKAAAGDWWVSLALIDGQTGQTLGVFTPDGARDHQVGIGPFHWAETAGGTR